MSNSEAYPWGDRRRYNSYSRYFRELFGGRIQKISVDAGFTCPNRDGTLGTGGCTFCVNDAFTPSYCHRGDSITRQIDDGIGFHARRYKKSTGFLVYFQSFSNTYKPLDELRDLYGQALAHPAVRGIVVGTRPDCVDASTLDYFARLSRDHYVVIEYGVESVYDTTLRAVNRGHDFACSKRAVEMTAARGIHCGAHFILGLPGETPQMLLEQAAVINALPLETVKFHQLQLFAGTPMERRYREHPEEFRFFSLDEYIDLFIDLLERLRPDLVIERFAGEAPERFQAGPSWGALRNERLVQLLEARLEQRGTWQGRIFR